MSGYFASLLFQSARVIPAGAVVEPGDRPEVFVALDDVGHGLDAYSAEPPGRAAAAARGLGSEPARGRDDGPDPGVRDSGSGTAASNKAVLAACAPRVALRLPGRARAVAACHSVRLLAAVDRNLARVGDRNPLSAVGIRSGRPSVGGADRVGRPRPASSEWAGSGVPRPVVSAAGAGAGAPRPIASAVGAGSGVPRPLASAEGAMPGDAGAARSGWRGVCFSPPPGSTVGSPEFPTARPAPERLAGSSSVRDGTIPPPSPPDPLFDDWPECESEPLAESFETGTIGRGHRRRRWLPRTRRRRHRLLFHSRRGGALRDRSPALGSIRRCKLRSFVLWVPGSGFQRMRFGQDQGRIAPESPSAGLLGASSGGGCSPAGLGSPSGRLCCSGGDGARSSRTRFFSDRSPRPRSPARTSQDPRRLRVGPAATRGRIPEAGPGCRKRRRLSLWRVRHVQSWSVRHRIEPRLAPGPRPHRARGWPL